MEDFDTIYQRACEHKGGETEVTALLPKVRSARAITNIGDDRFLSEMTRCVFQAGFKERFRHS